MTTRLHAAFVAICAIAAATATPAARAGRITLNDTGMTQCIGHQGNWSEDCDKSRQDAAYGRDVNDANPDDGVAGFSFSKVCRSGERAGEGTCPADPVLGNEPDNWGCVYDNVSGLTWEAKTDDGGIHDFLRPYTNKGGKSRDEPSDAAWLVDATNAEALCGVKNWRLPDVFELQSIVHYGVGTPGTPGGAFVDPTFFPYALSWETWTRDVAVWDSKRAWQINFDGGDINIEQRFYTGASARLVHKTTRALSRGDESLAKNRFIPSDDGTEVSDTLTGLVWSRCVVGMVWVNGAQTCEGTATEFKWADALDYAKANQEGGWRIPNVKELTSLADYEKPSPPAIDIGAFPNTPTAHLSSTPSFDQKLYVKWVSFGRGVVLQTDVTSGDSFPLRMVRRGRE
jgi:hypothetical protein